MKRGAQAPARSFSGPSDKAAKLRVNISYNENYNSICIKMQLTECHVGGEREADASSRPAEVPWTSRAGLWTKRQGGNVKSQQRQEQELGLQMTIIERVQRHLDGARHGLDPYD